MLVLISAHISTIAYVISSRVGNATKGATAVEYGLLVALIAAVIIAAVSLFGTNLSNQFAKVASAVKTK